MGKQNFCQKKDNIYRKAGQLIRKGADGGGGDFPAEEQFAAVAGTDGADVFLQVYHHMTGSAPGYGFLLGEHLTLLPCCVNGFLQFGEQL